jgi:hypothetical protein
VDVANYYVALKDQMSGPAAAASSGMAKLDAAITKTGSALSGMESKMVAAKAKLAQLQEGFGGKVDIGQVNRAKDSISALQAKMNEKRGELGSLQTAKAQLQELGGSTGKAGGGIDALSDKMPQLEGNLGKVQQALMKLGPAGVVAAAVFAVVTIAATVLIGTLLKLASTAISVSQQRGALESTFKALSTGAQSGKELAAAIDKVADSLPYTREQTATWAKALMGAGLEGETLEGRIRGVASASALMGEQGGAAAENLFKKLASGGQAAEEISKAIKAGGGEAAEQLAKMGVSAEDLAHALGTTPEKMRTMKTTAEQLGDALQTALITKGAGSLQAMSLTWASITGKLGDAWNDMFQDLGAAVTPFMGEIKSLFAEFSAGGATQGLVKTMLVSFLTTLFAIATRVTHAIHIGFLMAEIALLKVYIACAPVINAIRKFASSAEFLDGAVLILKAIGITLALIALPIVLVTVAFGIMVAVVVGAVVAIIAGVMWLVGAINGAGPAISGAIAGWAKSANQAATDFWMGIVNGIASGAGAVADAVRGLANAALGAFKGALGIKSPSMVMRVQGRYTAEGAALGIDDGADDVAASAEAMADGAASAGGDKPGASRAQGSDSRGNVFHVNITVPPGTPQSQADWLEIAVRRMLEVAGNAEPMPEPA